MWGVPARAWVEERSGNEKLQMVIKKADKTVYLGTDKPEEVWKHLIKQSGYMLTYFSNPFNIVRDAIKEAFAENLEVSNCSSYRITSFKYEAQLKANLLTGGKTDCNQRLRWYQSHLKLGDLMLTMGRGTIYENCKQKNV